MGTYMMFLMIYDTSEINQTEGNLMPQEILMIRKWIITVGISGTKGKKKKK